MSPVVTVEKLSKAYGAHLAVDDVSFDIQRGEVLGLLGPNGSGKTTILRILTGYLHASGGHVRVAGFDVVDQGIEARRRIGYVPEDAPLYPQMRVRESLQFMGRLKGLAGTHLSDAVDGVCDQLSLEPVISASVATLSRGYRQRVAIAQALLGEPDLLVLDEPTNGLDPRQIIELRRLIGDLASRHTLLVTSHILAEMERVATRVAILHDGRLLGTHSLTEQIITQVRIRVRCADAHALTTRLAAIDGVLRVIDVHSPEPGQIHALAELNSPHTVEAIPPALAQQHWPLLELSPVSMKLEQLFLSLTETTP